MHKYFMLKDYRWEHFTVNRYYSAKASYKILILGGGSAGCATAARFLRKFKENEICLVEPNEKHWYQPLFTLVGAGVRKIAQTWRPMGEVLPKNLKWVKDFAVEIDPENNCIVTENGCKIYYDILVVAIGTVPDIKKIPGLQEAYDMEDSGVCTTFLPEYCEKVYECTKQTMCGNAIFTLPHVPVKCPGAPQKSMYLADEYFRKMKRRDDIDVLYYTGAYSIFGVPHYAKVLNKICEKRNLEINVRYKLVEVRPEKHEVVFEKLPKQEKKKDSESSKKIKKSKSHHKSKNKVPPEKITLEYSMLCACPHFKTPEILHTNKLLSDKFGYATVNFLTMQHTKYCNIFAIGDCNNCPNSKTTAALCVQHKVAYDNILSLINGKPLISTYDGYASCPLVTRLGRVVLAEFDYSNKPKETFPIRGDRESYMAFLMKKYMFPWVYWNLHVKGYYEGPSKFRKLAHLYMVKDNEIPPHIKENKG